MNLLRYIRRWTRVHLELGGRALDQMEPCDRARCLAQIDDLTRMRQAGW